MTDPGLPLEQLVDLMGRAHAANEDAPLAYSSQDVADQWVLVPRAHLRTIQSWGGEVDEVEAIMMLANILADGRLLGVKEADDDASS